MSIYRVKDSEYLKKYRHGEKLDATKVVYARHMHYVEKKGIRALAREMGVAPSTMHDAIAGRTWAGVYPNRYHWWKEKPRWGGCRCEQCVLERKKSETASRAT